MKSDEETITDKTAQLRECFEDIIITIPDNEIDYFNEVLDIISKNIGSSFIDDESMKFVFNQENICGQFGSTNSKDLDMFITLKHKVSSSFMNAVKKYYTLWLTQILDMRGHHISKVDIQFIVVDDSEGIVSWSSKGNESEINNAIFHTYRYHALNYNITDSSIRACPVRHELHQDVGVKALKMIRSLITFLSRAENKYTQERLSDYFKKLLFEQSFTHRIHMVREYVEYNKGLISNIDTFNKPNHSDEDILKSLSFGFIQLYQLLLEEDVPFTKNQCIESDYCMLMPLILRYNSDHAPREATTKMLDAIIVECIDLLFDRIESDANGVLQLIDDEHCYDVIKESPTERSLSWN